MMQIHVKECALKASLGVYAEEKNAPRDIVVNASLVLADRLWEKAARSDAMVDTIDYVAVENAMKAVAEAKHYDLIEHLIYEMAKRIFALHKDIEQLSLEIEKPGALKHARTVAVQLDLMREDI